MLFRTQAGVCRQASCPSKLSWLIAFASLFSSFLRGTPWPSFCTFRVFSLHSALILDASWSAILVFALNILQHIPTEQLPTAHCPHPTCLVASSQALACWIEPHWRIVLYTKSRRSRLESEENWDADFLVVDSISLCIPCMRVNGSNLLQQGHLARENISTARAAKQRCRWSCKYLRNRRNTGIEKIPHRSFSLEWRQDFDELSW